MTQRAYLLGGRPADDGLIETGGHDDTIINIDRDEEVKYWSDRFGVPAEEIRQAVKSAGPIVGDVRQKLGNNRSNS